AGLAVRLVVVAGTTFKLTRPCDVAKLESPLYVAVSECVPVVEHDAVMAACPLGSGATGLPMVVPASLKVTFPLPPPGVTCTISLTVVFTVAGLREEV